MMSNRDMAQALMGHFCMGMILYFGMFFWSWASEKVPELML